MERDTLRQALKGLIATPITPFHPDYSLDIDAIGANARFLLTRGVRLFVVCGSIGEFASLTLEERERVLDETVRAVGDRGVVLANASATDQPSILRLAHHATRAGAAGIMVLLPYYYRLSDQEMLDFFSWLDASIDLPFVVYNNPGTTGMNIAPPVIDALTGLQRFAGLKEASPDVMRFHKTVRRFGHRFPVIAAAETPLPFFLLSGAPAVMTAAVDFAPEFIQDLFDAASAGDGARIWEIYDRLLAVRALIEPLLQQGYPAYIPFTKAGVEVRGLRAGAPRPPLRPLDLTTRERFEELLKTHLVPAHAQDPHRMRPSQEVRKR